MPSVPIFNFHHHFVEEKPSPSDKVGSEQVDVISALLVKYLRSSAWWISCVSLRTDVKSCYIRVRSVILFN